MTLGAKHRIGMLGHGCIQQADARLSEMLNRHQTKNKMVTSFSAFFACSDDYSPGCKNKLWLDRQITPVVFGQ